MIIMFLLCRCWLLKIYGCDHGSLICAFRLTEVNCRSFARRASQIHGRVIFEEFYNADTSYISQTSIIIFKNNCCMTACCRKFRIRKLKYLFSASGQCRDSSEVDGWQVELGPTASRRSPVVHVSVTRINFIMARRRPGPGVKVDFGRDLVN